MSLRVAELETLFTANVTDYETGAKKVTASQKAIAKSDPVVKVTADTATATTSMDKVAKAAKKIDIEKTTAKIDAETDAAAAKVKKFKDETNAAMTEVGQVAMAGGLVAAAGVAAAVVKFADFDAAMSKAQAGTMATGAALGDLREAAVEGGRATQFSATEAANAITEMGKAGVSTKDILGGGLAGALDLAAAGQLEVGRAGEIASIALKQFNLEGKDLPHVADLLAAGAGKAMGSVEDLAQAMKYVGPVAKNLDVSIEQTTGTLAELASQGIIGEQAGTSLRGMLLSLTSPSKIAAATMADLGIEMYDANGKFIGLEGAAGQLESRMGSLSDADRNAAMGRIFGNEQITAANILYSGGAKAVAEWTAKVSDAGFAARQAAMLTDNLTGDMERLGGSLDTVLIQTGSGANGVLRDMAQAAEGAVNAFGSLSPATLTTTLAIGGVVAAAGLLGGGFLIAAPRIVATRAALTQLTTAAPRATAALTGLGSAAGGIAIAVGALTVLDSVMGKIGGQALSVEQTTTALLKMGTSASALDDAFSGLGAGLNSVDGLKGAIKQLVDPSMLQRMSDFGIKMSTFGVMDNKQTAKIKEQFGVIGDSLAGLVTSGNVDVAREQFEVLRSAWEQGGGTIEELRAAMPGYVDALAGLSNEQSLAGDSAKYYADGVTAVSPAIDEAIAAQEDWVKAVADSDASFIGLGTSWDNVIQKNQDAAQATADSTESSEDSWQTYYDGVSASVDAYLADLETQVLAQQNWETNMLLLSGRVSQGVIDELQRLGPEGAPLVANLVNASDAELARLEEVYGQRSAEATGAFAANLLNAGPIIAAAGAQLGVGAANEIAAKLASGELTIQQVIDNYNLTGVTVPVDVNLTPAQVALDQWLKDNASHKIHIAMGLGGAGGQVAGAATGGLLTGPGTGTSDSFLIRASNREFMVNAAATARNLPLLHAINSGAAGYKDGGLVEATSRFGMTLAAPSSSASVSSNGTTAPTASGGVTQVIHVTINEVTDPIGTMHAVTLGIAQMGAV